MLQFYITVGKQQEIRPFVLVSNLDHVSGKPVPVIDYQTTDGGSHEALTGDGCLSPWQSRSFLKASCRVGKMTSLEKGQPTVDLFLSARIILGCGRWWWRDRFDGFG